MCTDWFHPFNDGNWQPVLLSAEFAPKTHKMRSYNEITSRRDASTDPNSSDYTRMSVANPMQNQQYASTHSRLQTGSLMQEQHELQPPCEVGY